MSPARHSRSLSPSLIVARVAAAAIAVALLAAVPGHAQPAKTAGGCTNYGKGTWVRDNSRPAYDSNTCKFMGVSNCLRQTGRSKDWLYWSWKPNGCPANGMRFDALGFLKLMKNKVFASVGESISVRGFLLAVVCNVAKYTEVKMLAKPNKFGNTEVYYVPSHNVTLVNFWAAFLVAIDTSKETLARFGNTKPALQDTVVNLHKLDPAWAAHLDKVHVIVLQTAADWPAGRDLMRRYYTDANWNAITPKPSTYGAYEIAMRTVFNAFAGRSTRGKPFPVPFFLSAPPRLNGCQNVSSLSSPQQVTSLFNDNKASKSFLPIQQKVFQNRRPFRFLPITYLSLFRGDAFMSSSGAHDGGRDCLHFCLPGVPDTWADALYTTMKSDQFLVNNAAK
ncbi:hypothetical protein CLOM_g10486 [Closterium sp. NIES-68]|nr:hypothetical protein CLOM_g10486 [Closterium sp. NIES-68]GJP82873.1 hypothetical protein CLOP_g13099 [Closterium sp. NIES-67]